MMDISSARDCKFSKTRYTRILFNIGVSPVSQYSRGSSNDLHLATHQIIFFPFSPLRNRRVIPQPFHIALPYGQALTPRISL